MTLADRVRKVVKACPCRSTREGCCITEILCKCCADYEEGRRPLADPCEWAGHAALHELVEAWPGCHGEGFCLGPLAPCLGCKERAIALKVLEP